MGSTPTRRIFSRTMTRQRHEVERALALVRQGLNDCQVSRATGIPRGTVRDWRHGRVPKRDPGPGSAGRACPGCDLYETLLDPQLPFYSYLLGLYLGDGCISAHRRGVFRLRILLDRRHQDIIRECAQAMAAVRPWNRVGVRPHRDEQADEVSSFWKHWPCVLPQHGAGKKHERAIHLAEWQEEILDRHPWRFLRGLIHSDGCRFMNRIKHPKKTYIYPRYNFTNHSDDIRELFCEYCDKVGVEWRQMNRWNISVARRESVALMDRFIGPKR